VGGADGCGQHLVGPQRRQIPYAAVDPVADQLDPAIATLRLQGHRVGELCLVFDVDRQAGDVALGAGQVPAGADDARQVVAVVEAAGVDRRSAVAQQQCAGLTIGLGLRDRLLEFNAASRTQPDMAVGIDQPGQNPAAVENRVGAADRFAADPVIGDPQFDGFFVG
jgi:hypothetical protein